MSHYVGSLTAMECDEPLFAELGIEVKSKKPIPIAQGHFDYEVRMPFATLDHIQPLWGSWIWSLDFEAQPEECPF